MINNIVYYCIIVPLKFIFFGIEFEEYRWYRKMKGGTWVNYFPRMYPYKNSWTRGLLYQHEVECKQENWGPMIIKDNVAEKKKRRKIRLTIND